ncbi:MAG TPA: ABC transporter ATP-binding protein [Candidatus Limnocylindrales bacterium]|nr:ABC transporter ATP-binding protein [Candidatus Limnocylindrales bacterium]
MTATLEVQGLSKRFGGVRALVDFGIELAAGEVRGLIGPNGSGKSTTMHLISGFLHADAGTIRLGGRPVNRLSPQRRAALGLGRTFQSPNLFPGLTVLENVLAGCHAVDRRGTHILDVYARPRSSRESLETMTARSMSALESIGLADRAHELAVLLAYGEQKLLGVARALVSDPTVILMDEPLAGLGPTEAERLLRIVDELRQTGRTVLLAEHDVPVVMSVCDRITVLNFGVTIAEGTPDEVQRHPEVLDAYLGREEPDGAG